MALKKREAVVPADVVVRLLQTAATSELVLVGGQALAFWMANYRLIHKASGLPAITADVDFLAPRADDRQAVSRLAQALKGRSLFPNKRALTALVGQAVLETSEEEYYNVDVLFDVLGLPADKVRERSVEVAGQCHVMHPMDVLYSRLINLHKITEKQNDKGRAQLAFAIDVGREFIRAHVAQQQAPVGGTRSPALPFFKLIQRWALDDAGRLVAVRHGLHIADAIDPTLVPETSMFWKKQWPALQALMSPDYLQQLCDDGVEVAACRAANSRPVPPRGIC